MLLSGDSCQQDGRLHRRDLQCSRRRQAKFENGINNVGNVADVDLNVVVVTADNDDGDDDDERQPVAGPQAQQHFQVQVLVEDQSRVAAKAHRRGTPRSDRDHERPLTSSRSEKILHPTEEPLGGPLPLDM